MHKVNTTDADAAIPIASRPPAALEKRRAASDSSADSAQNARMLSR